MRLLADDNNQLARDDLGVELAARWLDNIFVINRDLSMGMAWKIQAPYVDLFGPNEIDALHDGWRSLIHNLHKNAQLQFVFESVSPKDADSLAKFKRPVVHPFLNSILEEKQKALSDQFTAGNLRLMNGYVILNLHTGITTEKVEDRIEEIAEGKIERLKNTVVRFVARKWENFVLKHFNPELMQKCTTEQYVEMRNELAQAADVVHIKLNQMNLKPEVLEREAAVDLLFRFNHPNSYEHGARARAWSQDDLLPIYRHYLTGGAERNLGSYIRTDDAYHKILTVRNPPMELDFNVWAKVLLHRGSHRVRVVTTLHRESMDERKKYLKDRLNIAEMKAQQDETFQIQASQISASLTELGSGVESAWWGRSVVHCWGLTKEEVDQEARNVMTASTDQEGFEIVPEDVACWDYWRASQPYWTREQDKHRDIPYTAREAATLIPLLGQDTLMQRPNIGGIYGTGCGSIFNFYLHSDPPVPGGIEFANYNAVICGGSGSGKTFFANDLLAQMSAHPQGAHCICIDFKKPGSFRAMAMARGGNYIDFDLESDKNCINPFQLAPGHKMDRDHIDAVIDSLCKRIADPAVNKGHVSGEERTVIERVIQEKVIQSDGQGFIMEDFYNLLMKHSPELGRRLQPWVGQGRYAKLCNGKSNISFDNPFTVFDFERIADNKQLCCVMFSTVITAAMNMAIQKPGPKFLVFDEAWEYMEDEMMAQFIVRAFRVLRAAGFSVIAISQGIEDFTKLKNKSAILMNISHYVVLRQNTPDAAQALAEELDFNSQEVARAKSLQVVSGRYSQALIVQKRTDGRRVSVVINNQASPLAYWACTTKKAERDYVRSHVATGQSYFQALAEASQKYPHGMLQ